MLTLPSVAGEFSGRGVPLSERVELLKWLAVALMLIDHAARYLDVQFPGFQVLGRGAFPMFALCVGYALSVVPDARGFLVRLLYAGVMAEALGAWAITGGQLNVLFLFALCAWLVHLERAGRSVTRRAICWGVAILLAELTEYGIAGLLLVMASLFFWRSTSWQRAGCVLLSSVLLVVPNDSFLGTWWLGAAFVLLLLPMGVPRIKRAFYWVYVAQWPVVWGLR